MEAMSILLNMTIYGNLVIILVDIIVQINNIVLAL